MVYHFTIVEEETKLKILFGAPYLVYLEAVNRFFPGPPPAREKRLRINAFENESSFSWEVARQNKAWDAYAAFVGFAFYLIACAWLWKIIA